MKVLKEKFLMKRQEKIINYLSNLYYLQDKKLLHYGNIVNDHFIIYIYDYEDKDINSIWVSLLIRVTTKRLKEIESRIV